MAAGFFYWPGHRFCMQLTAKAAAPAAGGLFLHRLCDNSAKVQRLLIFAESVRRRRSGSVARINYSPFRERLGPLNDPGNGRWRLIGRTAKTGSQRARWTEGGVMPLPSSTTGRHDAGMRSSEPVWFWMEPCEQGSAERVDGPPAKEPSWTTATSNNSDIAWRRRADPLLKLAGLSALAPIAGNPLRRRRCRAPSRRWSGLC